MFQQLPPDILRNIVGRVEGLDVIRLESASKDVRDLTSGDDRKLDLVLTKKRLSRGAGAWLEKYGHRVRSLTCLRGYTPPPRDGIERFAVRYHTVFPSNFLDLYMHTTLVSLTLTLDRGMTDHRRDAILSSMPNLRALSLTFPKSHFDVVRFKAPKTLISLRINVKGSRLTIVAFPDEVERINVRARDGLWFADTLPLSIQSLAVYDTFPGDDLHDIFRHDGVYDRLTTLDLEITGMPSLMYILRRCPVLEVLRCTANTLVLGDELVISRALRRIFLWAHGVFAVGPVRAESVRRLTAVPKVNAYYTDARTPMDLLEFYGMLTA